MINFEECFASQKRGILEIQIYLTLNVRKQIYDIEFGDGMLYSINFLIAQSGRNLLRMKKKSRKWQLRLFPKPNLQNQPPFLNIRANLPPVQFHNPLDNCQAQAGASRITAGSIPLVKTFK